MVHLLRLLDLADELASTPARVVVARSGRRSGSYDDAIPVSRHRDRVVVEARDVKPQLAAPTAVRVLEEQRLHLTDVQAVRASPSTSHERLQRRIVAAIFGSLDRKQLDHLFAHARYVAVPVAPLLAQLFVDSLLDLFETRLLSRAEREVVVRQRNLESTSALAARSA